MRKPVYRMTKSFKNFIIQFIVCLAGVSCGIFWGILNKNNKWSTLYYPNVYVASVDLGGRTRDEGARLLREEYLGNLGDYSINIKALEKSYKMELHKIIQGISINEALDKAFFINKDLSFFEKHRTLKESSIKNFEIDIKFDEDYIEGFIKDIQNDINRRPVNSFIEETPYGGINIVDDIKGVELKTGELKNLIKDMVKKKTFQPLEIELPTKEINAPINADVLKDIDCKITSHSISFASAPLGRIRNIELSSEAINGILLFPGEIFSFNDVVGERTEDRGYMVASVLEDGNYKSGLGGGICLVSSTLYNAVLKSGIIPIERRNHSLPASYIDLGLDATVSWGTIDFKFKNTLEYPIYIKSYVENMVLYVDLYSNSILNEKEYIIKSNTYEEIERETQIVEDERLEQGMTRVIQEGSNGYRVKTVRITYENDKVIGTETISHDYYKPIDKVVKKGIRIIEKE